MQFRVKEGVYFDAEYVERAETDTSVDGGYYLVHLGDKAEPGDEPDQVSKEVFEYFFEPVGVETGATEQSDRLEAFEGMDGQWYWHRQAANGQVISTGGEGYTRRFDAEQAAQRSNPGVTLRTSLV